MASSSAAANPRVLMLIPSYEKQGIEAAVAAGNHPMMDYHALQQRLNGHIYDYSALDADTRPLVKLARKLGKDAGLAMAGFLSRRAYDVIYSNGENVSIPLAALLMMTRKRPGHILIGHHLSTPKKRLFFKALKSKMDAIFVYAETQRRYGIDILGIPENRMILIPFHADHRFYHPMGNSADNVISSAGLEWRDYPTLIEAVRELTVEVRLAAASPWSKHRNETEDQSLPTNVSAKRYSYEELRELYAASKFVVVPLYENDFQAGVTTILEAMAMGKAVIATQTIGQKDVIEDGVNGIYVPPGDAASLKNAIERLLASPEEAERLGNAARRTIEKRMTLDHWAESIAQRVREAGATPQEQVSGRFVAHPEEN